MCQVENIYLKWIYNRKNLFHFTRVPKGEVTCLVPISYLSKNRRQNWDKGVLYLLHSFLLQQIGCYLLLLLCIV